MRKIIVDMFEIIHSEELPDNCINYTKKKLGTQVMDFPEDTPIEDIKAQMRKSAEIVIGEMK